MDKFVRLEVIETDNDGYLALKGFLPEGCIIWCRSVGEKVIIKLKHDVDISAIVQQFNLVYDTLTHNKTTQILILLVTHKNTYLT